MFAGFFLAVVFFAGFFLAAVFFAGFFLAAARFFARYSFNFLDALSNALVILSSDLVLFSISLTTFAAFLWLEVIVLRNDGFDLVCFLICVVIFDLISSKLETSPVIFFSVFWRFLISEINSWTWSFNERNLASAFCFSSGVSAILILVLFVQLLLFHYLPSLQHLILIFECFLPEHFF